MKQIVIAALVIILIPFDTQTQYVPRNLYVNGYIFEDVTEGSGFDHMGHGKCIALGDFDMDGDLDIYISIVFSGNRFFQNEGNLHFKDMTSIVRLGCKYDTHGIVWADFDNNGYLDIFAANNLESLSQQRSEVLQPNEFYLAGDEGFVESSVRAGLTGNTFNYSCGVTTADVNGDGLLDIYVAEGGYRSGHRPAD